MQRKKKDEKKRQRGKKIQSIKTRRDFERDYGSLLRPSIGLSVGLYI
jgi:hypothetical protein